MKKIGLIALLVCTINFLALAGGAGYLFGTGIIDGEKLAQIKTLLFPPPPPPASQPALDARDPATTQPLLKFDELLNMQTGKTASEQVTFLRETFDAMSASLERQRREVIDQRRQIDLAQSQAARDRQALDDRQKSLDDRQKQQKSLDEDTGFKQTLEIYTAMDVKQLKDLFLKLDERTVVRYLQAMEPRRVSRIVKEFTTPAELQKAQTLLEMMRLNDAPPEANAASSGTAPPAP